MRSTLLVCLLLTACGGASTGPLSKVVSSTDLRLSLTVSDAVDVSLGFSQPSSPYIPATCLVLSSSATATFNGQALTVDSTGGVTDHSSELGVVSQDCKVASFTGRVPLSSLTDPGQLTVTDGDGHADVVFHVLDAASLPRDSSTHKLEVTACTGPSSCSAEERR